MSNLEKMHSLVIEWIRDAADYIRSELDEQLSVEVKTTPNDLVTNLDFETEKFIVNKIRETFPEHKIVSEEGFGDEVKNLDGSIWFIDPIDGTLNFVKQKENFCIMLAYYEDGVGLLAYIYDVMKDKFYHVIKDEGVYCNGKRIESILDRGLNDGLTALNSKLISDARNEDINKVISESLGLRLYGSAGIESMEVVSSRTVAYIAMNLKPWDFAPGNVFIHELGGKMTDFDNNPINLLESCKIVIANKKAHKEIMDIFNQ